MDQLCHRYPPPAVALTLVDPVANAGSRQTDSTALVAPLRCLSALAARLLLPTAVLVPDAHPRQRQSGHRFQAPRAPERRSAHPLSSRVLAQLLPLCQKMVTSAVREPVRQLRRPYLGRRSVWPHYCPPADQVSALVLKHRVRALWPLRLAAYSAVSVLGVTVSLSAVAMGRMVVTQVGVLIVRGVRSVLLHL